MRFNNYLKAGIDAGVEFVLSVKFASLLLISDIPGLRIYEVTDSQISISK